MKNIFNKTLILAVTILSINSFAGMKWSNYDKQAEAKIKSGEPVLLGFHKKGCGTCASQDTQLEKALVNKLEKLNLVKVEKTNSKLKPVYKKYGYKSNQFASVIFFNKGKEVSRLNPFETKSKAIKAFAQSVENELN